MGERVGPMPGKRDVESDWDDPDSWGLQKPRQIGAKSLVWRQMLASIESKPKNCT